MTSVSAGHIKLLKWELKKGQIERETETDMQTDRQRERQTVRERGRKTNR